MTKIVAVAEAGHRTGPRRGDRRRLPAGRELRSRHRGASARFATPGVNIGLFCSTPMVALSRAVGRKAAMEMLLTGELIDADRARELGLINRVVPEAELDDAVTALATQIAGKSPLTLAIGKEAFYRQAEMPLDDAYSYASRVMTDNMLARDAEVGIDAFLAKRAPVWTGK